MFFAQRLAVAHSSLHPEDLKSADHNLDALQFLYSSVGSAGPTLDAFGGLRPNCAYFDLGFERALTLS